MTTTRKTTLQEMEVMEYLNQLRSDGTTNMFGALPYIMQQFNDLGRKESQRILELWMSNFNEAGNYEEVKVNS